MFKSIGILRIYQSNPGIKYEPLKSYKENDKVPSIDQRLHAHILGGSWLLGFGLYWLC